MTNSSVLRVDIETFSSADLKKVGVYRYAEAPDFQVMLFGYAFDGDPVRVVDLARGEALPDDVVEALGDAAVLKMAYNAAFEVTCLSRHFGRPLDVTQWRCTSVHALYLGLPGNLAEVGRVLGLAPDKAKLATGGALIRYFCVPCKPTKKNGGRTRNLPQHDPGRWDLFIEYCRRDVAAEREIAWLLDAWPVPEREWRLWHLDQRMMTRGCLADPALIDAAIEADQLVRGRLMDKAMELTGLANPNSRNQLLAWLNEEVDEEVADLTKKSVPKLLEATDNPVVREVLQVRQALAKASVAKYRAMGRAMCDDAALRGLTQFYGANRTGRWAGRIVQVQNVPANRLRDIDLARALVRSRRFDDVEMLFGSMPEVLSQCLRTAFVARPGHQILSVDFSAIEARVVAWLAWCAWRLKVFSTHGKIYEASAEQMFKLPAGSVTKKSPYRQRGKVAELALGYLGGANALKTMGALEMGLTEDELQPIVDAWRAANPEIVDLAYALERAAKHAVAGRVATSVPVADGRLRITFEVEGSAGAGRWLFMSLPAGRRLAYRAPRLEGEPLVKQATDGTEYVVARAGSLTYEGLDQKTKRWTRMSTYAGKLLENLTQALARDCLAEAMLRIDDELPGVAQLFTVHDEIVLEAPVDAPDALPAVEAVMARPLDWAPDLKLRADGFVAPYYMKEIE